MSDNTDQNPTENVDVHGTPPAPEAPETPVVETVDIDPQEIEKGKVFAILSYIQPLWIIPIIQKDNDFAIYHAKQGLLIFLAGIALSIVSGILTLLCIGPIVGSIGGLVLFVFSILGLVNAIKGVAKPMPLIGKFAIDWFKGIQKKA